MNHDEEAADMFNDMNSFSDKYIRLAFIKKVYAILFVQIGITCGFISLFLFCEPLKEYCIENSWPWILALVMTFILIIMLSCFPDFRRRTPMNFVILFAFTICEGFLLGTVSSYYDKDEVLMAVGITAVVSLALTIFAFQTKWDFTMMGGMLFVFLIILICFGLLVLILPHNRILSLVYASLGALLFSAYIVFDTQIMLGGKHKYSLSPEEYIFAALNLYLDIINLFLFILSIFGKN